MKLVLCLVFCLGLALARVEEWSWLNQENSDLTIKDTEFQSGREYHYFYDGQITTGIPGSSKQHSGTRVQAMVLFVFKSSNTCLMKLTNVRMGKTNRDLPNPRKIVPFDSFEEVQIEEKQKEKLLLSVKFAYNGGMISKVIFDGEDQPWSANIKRGIMNLLHVNLKQQNALDAIDPRMSNMASRDENEDTAFYRVLEETIEGECETLYTMTKQPNQKSDKREVLNITKSINFEKCKKRPQIKYNFRFSDPCPTCESKYNEDEKFLKSSTVAFYNITGTVNKFRIDSARVESEYTFIPFNEESNVIVTYVNQTLVLVKSGQISKDIEEPRKQVQSDSNMIYTLDWDMAKEAFDMEGTNVDGKLLFSKVPNKIELVGTLLQKLVSKMQEFVQDDAPSYFDNLIKLFRTCSQEEIEQVHSMYYMGSKFDREEQKKIRDILPHVNALCGTKVCVQHLAEKIRTTEIPTLTAVLALKDLVNIQTPSKEIIQELLKLSESEIVERNFALKQSTWLTIGSLMNALCSNDVDKWAREIRDSEKFCPRQLKEKYVKLIVDKFQSTKKWEERLTYLKALGNAGLDLSVYELEKIVRNRDSHYSPLIKTEAVLAMRQLKNIMPKKIQNVLMPVLLNKLEPPTLRIACSYMILETMPERPVLDQISKMIHTEQSLQVASFVHSYMNTLANSTNPCEKRLAAELRLSLRLTRKINTSPLGYSKIVRLPVHSHQHKVGLDLELASSFSNASFIPRYLTATLHSNFLGFWNKYLVTFGLVNEGLETLMRRFYGEQNAFTDQSLDEIYTHGPRPTFGYEQELRNIFSSLNIQSRDVEENNEEPKAMFYMKFKDQDYGFLPIKEEMIKSYLQDNKFNMREIETKLRQGVTVNFNKATVLHEMMYKIPTTIGMPLSVTTKVPLVLSVQGKLQGISNSERSLKSFKIEANLKPSLVANLIVDIECWSPIVKHGLKVLNKIKFFQPVDAKLEVDLQSNPKTVKIVVRPPSTRRNLITLESRPITYTHEWRQFLTTFSEPEERTVMGEEVNRIHTLNQCVGRKTLGVELCLRGQIHKSLSNTIAGTPFFPLSGPNKIVLTVEPGHDAPQEIVIRLTGKFFESSGESFRPKMFNDAETFRSFEEEDRDDRYTQSGINDDERRSSRNNERDSRFNERDSRYNERNERERGNFRSSERNERSTRESDRNVREGTRRHQDNERSERNSRFNDEPNSRYNAERNSRYNEERSPRNNEERNSWNNEERNSWNNEDRNSRYNERNEQSNERRQRDSMRSNERNGRKSRYNEREQESTEFNMKQSLTNNIRVDVQSGSRKFVFDLNHLYDMAGRYGKFNVKLARSPVPEDNQPFMVCLDSESLFPNVPMVTREVNDDKVLTSAKFTWGRTCESRNFISIKSKASKSRMQQNYEHETPEYRTYEKCQDQSWCSPVSQNEYLNEVSDLMKYNIDIDYNNVPIEVQNYTNKLFIMLKHHFYENVDIAQMMVRNPENKIRVDVTIDPVTKQHINVTIKTPKENTTIYDIQTPFVLTPVNTKQSYGKGLLDTFNEDSTTATCHISSRKVSTFDKVEYSVPLSTCYAVLAKDCSSNPRFVVMMRKISEKSDRKEIKIMSTSHKIVLTASSESDDRIKCTVNDQEKDLNEDVVLTERNSPVLRIIKQRSQVKVELLNAGVTVTFDGHAANIEISHIYRNKQCGLCGHFDMETQDEFRTPDNQITEDVREFYMKYITKGKDCRQPERDQMETRQSEREQMDTDSSYSYKPYWETTDEITSEDERMNDDTPIVKQKVIETEDQICISMDSVPECPTNTYSKNKVEKRVPYHCLHHNDANAWEYQNQIRYGERVQLGNVKPTMTRTEYVPTKCEPIH